MSTYDVADGDDDNTMAAAADETVEDMMLSSSSASSDSSEMGTMLATSVGYLIGFGSLMLYTPIAVRILRQKHAEGLVMGTWWLKCISYVFSDVYYIRRHYVLSTYAETVIITIEAGAILLLVAYYQHQLHHFYPFWMMSGIFLIIILYLGILAPLQVTALGQISSAFINIAALVPQFYYNYTHQSKGDYSPFTAVLAGVGCFLRLNTTRILNDSDPVLLLTFGLAMVFNFALLFQILYYGIRVEGLTFKEVMCADINTEHNSNNNNSIALRDVNGEMMHISSPTTMEQHHHSYNNINDHHHHLPAITATVQKHDTNNCNDGRIINTDQGLTSSVLPTTNPGKLE